MGFQRKNSNTMFFPQKLNEILWRFQVEFIRNYSFSHNHGNGKWLWKVTIGDTPIFLTSMGGRLFLKLHVFWIWSSSRLQGGESLRIFKKISKTPEALRGRRREKAGSVTWQKIELEAWECACLRGLSKIKFRQTKVFFFGGWWPFSGEIRFIVKRFYSGYRLLTFHLNANIY